MPGEYNIGVKYVYNTIEIMEVLERRCIGKIRAVKGEGLAGDKGGRED